MNTTSSNHNPKYSVLVVGYRSLRFLEDCLNSLLATDFASYEILFLDNHSPDPEADWVESHFHDPRLKVFRSPTNLLFAGGMNFLSAKAQGEFLILLNPDARVESTWLTVLDAARVEGKWEAAQMDLRNAANPEERETQGPHLDRLGFIRHISRPDAVQPFRIFSGRGAGVMIDRNWFLKLDGLDEDMGMYFEETDFFWRLNIAGGKVYFVPGARIYHVRGGSAKAHGFDWGVYRFTRNRILSLCKNLQLHNLIIFLPAHIAIYFFRIILSAVRFQWRQSIAESAALISAVVLIPKFIAKRNSLSRLRKLSDAELIDKNLLLSPSKPVAQLQKLFGKRKSLNGF